jgi:hypothetical protein
MTFLPGEITTREHCYDRIEPLAKHAANPVMVADRPWEEPGVYWPCVLRSRQDNLFRMWYYVNLREGTRLAEHLPAAPSRTHGWFYACYAESEDGLHWKKPALGKVSLPGCPDTNILFADSGYSLGIVSVIEDLEDTRDRRFKMLWYENDGQGTCGARTAVSPNGINWRPVGGFPVLPSQDTLSLWHDRERGQYVVFFKERLDNKRALMVSVSPDFFTWSDPSVLLAPDLADSPTLHLYAHAAFRDGGHDLGFLNLYELSTQTASIELVASRRGPNLYRLPTRPTVLWPGRAGSWDDGGVYVGLGKPIAASGEVWVYYCGSPTRHDEGVGRSGIGIATFAPGRLAGQQFEGDGWFESAPFRCPGGELSLDAVARHPLRVEVCGAAYGGPLPGYTAAACVPVEGDSQTHAIRWESQLNLDELRGRFVRIKVHGKNSVVYGCRLETA